ncbi:hypothetical protein SCOR_31600 [Sulfidibacter corallicola]|uniref:VCBS repeat-containing protein n=1 Tax=Sulfidibacter corallicola TaxID=2818388 RepID=A0A8A4TTP2_SULCO|nr:hypothetical protein [Sulfidibacter corallicola]QTD49905.1 hypothetical protein J3U87_30355 [Sulfidibacter corallicola]
MSTSRFPTPSAALLPALFVLALAPLQAATLELKGLPLQMEWSDLDGDGQLDLVALMIETRVEGTFDTTFEAGGLRGFYQDHTIKEKYLATYRNTGQGFEKVDHMPLEKMAVLGFALEPHPRPRLALWTLPDLIYHDWQDATWKPINRHATPGFLYQQPISGQQFPFWQSTAQGPLWVVPDLTGIHFLDPDRQFSHSFWDYPQIDTPRDEGMSDNHRFSLPLPYFMDVDGDGRQEMVYQESKTLSALRLDDRNTVYEGMGEGLLADFTGDGLADLMVIADETDVDGPKDLKKVKSQVHVFPATAPLQFADTPRTDQWLPGFVINNDSDFMMPDPYLDVDNDGLLDLAGISIKFSLWQVAKVATLGRMSLKFLLFLSRQDEHGKFHTIPGSPFEMSWKINLRKLKLPEFAQMTGDFDGNGWRDILIVKNKRLEITPLSKAGFEYKKTWKHSLPRTFHDPDQVFGKDLNNNGQDAFVVIKLEKNRTHLGVWEVQP